MTEPDNYLWTGEGEADAFVAELEQRLSPLDDAEALFAELELEQLAARELELDVLAQHISLAPEPASAPSVQAEPSPRPELPAAPLALASSTPALAEEPVQLRPRESSASKPAPSRLVGWAWLAAAVAVLGLSVGVLMSESSERRSADSGRVEITGSSAATRVVIDAAPEHHAALRDAHAALSSCALELEPSESQTLALRLHASEVELDEATPASAAATCVASAFTALELEPAQPLRLRVELHGPSAR